MTEIEQSFGFPSRIIAGVDEVGRGCLAGPVVAAAVVLPLASPEQIYREFPWLSEVTDSKKLSPQLREYLKPLIESWALGWAIGSASVEEIDRLNIYHASHLAMSRAVEEILKKQKIDHLLVDGNKIPVQIKFSASAVVKGDLKCLSIACASILAKVHRDRLMDSLDVSFPQYGLARHKGYPTPFHKEALQKWGAAGIHRRSFGPVAEVLK